MSFAKITAIVRPTVVTAIEETLHEAGVPGMSVTQAKGYGDYADFFRKDWMVTHVRIEVFIAASRAESIAELIMEAAHTGLDGDGLVAIVPVSAIYHIRTRKRCREDAC
ncbi:MAG TPA: P-II family nitrogen regulator [Thiolapillus brandeum]|uniref:P-II family nitrogen regulator n=1 Tax=Thiolapillus brandeum TaxID=1076588 RepID=A0A831RZ98_9GAMM|nr:P-II family nitrogen regulator [Thiolapillus brandeum]